MKRTLILAASMAVWAVHASTVTVVAPQEGAAKTATVGGKPSMSYNAGATAALKAVANAGWSFAGWYESYDAETGIFSNEVALAKSADWRSPTANYVVGESDKILFARFVHPGEDGLVFDMASVFEGLAQEFDEKGRPVLAVGTNVDEIVAFDSLSFPSVTVAGLPSGLSFDRSSLRLAGSPSASGVYRVSVSAKNESGYSFVQVFYVRVANVVSEHIEGFDREIDVGDEVDEYLSDIFDIFNTNATVRSLSVSGLPPGLALESETYSDEKEYFVHGTATKEGEYLVTCKVAFSNDTAETASMLYTVNGPDPFYYDGDVDFSTLEGYSVGDAISLEDDLVLGDYDAENKVGVTAVSGLPSGISVVKRAIDQGVDYVLRGAFQKPGEFQVTVKVAYEDWEVDSIATVTFTKSVIVSDRQGIYIAADVLDPETSPGCKVTGSGVYSVGATARLTATAGRDLVFAGWCDSAGLPVAVGVEDFRKSPASVFVGDDVEREWYADFILKSDDFVDVSSLADAELELDSSDTEPFSHSFIVDSGSLPTLKFSNLPAGLTCSPSVDMAGDYVLSYDPATAAKKPAPGRYRAQVTATNVSRLSDTANFLVTVSNYRDDDIHVDEDYGVLTPNVQMAPISLSNAVNFARGDTLVVSGLPTGLKYNDKATPYCLSGIPTKPGEYTLTFKAKIVESVVTNEATQRVTYDYRTAVATAYILVKDFPTVAAVIPGEAAGAGCKVSGTGSFKAGTKTTLKATAAQDWVFAGWSGAGAPSGFAALNPSLPYVMGTDDLTEIDADFIHKRDDTLFVDDPGVVAVVKNEAYSTNLVENLIETRSLPTVSVTGLPTGLKFDAKTFLVSGTVGKTAKSGYFYVTVAAKNASGYAFTRILKFVVLETAGEPIPDEPMLPNEADIDFSDLDSLMTGGFCPAGGAEAVGFVVSPSESGSDVTAVSVSGLPSGLKSAVSIEDGVAEAVLYGTPNKPGRCEVKVQVTYADRGRATSQYAFIVEDGGSGWLDVESFDNLAGTVSGSGVYASGAAVKLAAKPAAGKSFAGWYEDEDLPFDILAETDVVDFRTAAASFVFRKGMFALEPFALYGNFVAKADDTVILDGFGDMWEIDPAADSEFFFTADSSSLPKLTVSGLPKGVVLNAAAGKFVYSSASQTQIVPGYYKVAVKAVNQSNVSAAAILTVFVANKTSDAIGGLDPAADAYPLHAGVVLDPEAIMPEVDTADGWKLSAAGLPAGLSLKSGQDEFGNVYYYVAGVPSKAGTNTVTFTATKGTVKEVATITVGVAALPVWSVGMFDGAYCTFEEGETNAIGQVSVSVSATGKVSGKILKGGKTYQFSASSFDAYDSQSTNFSAIVVVPWTTTEKPSYCLSVGVDENGVGAVVLEPVGDGAEYAWAVQNVWSRADLKPEIPPFATGTKQPVLALADGVSMKFGANGVVTVGGNVGGIAVSGKAQTLAIFDPSTGANARVVVYVANTKLEGGSLCEVVDVILSDEDGDGKLDHAVLP